MASTELDLAAMNEAMFGDRYADAVAESEVDEVPEDAEVVRTPWRVDDDAAAEWAMQRLAMANEEVRRLREQADDWQSRIQAWFVQAARQHQRTAEFMEDRLGDYGLRLRAAGGPSSLVMPSGTIKTTESKPVAVVEDEATLALYLDAMLGAPNHALTDDEAVAWAAWQMAWSAACAGMDEPLQVVKRTPKVYLTPLRKLVAVGKVSEGVWARSALACGHHVDQQAADLYDPDVPSRGDMLPCLACPLDLLDQAPPYVPVEVTIVEERFRAVVVGPDGSEVPGTMVDPGGVTVNVKAR